ncbi:MAG: UDP-glucose 6-dehydrogenase TuaD [Chlamydiia bacterium]|nr:UDP-glucose 6-dehydrogenase TuaD [Chlamydiia bacterium]MCH9615787.1 UDP-glucose 6-dehydrogenase TuaD [Chlamydiia bacterium]MCH9628810.1 UDP-glucose 6-dehydrogenase TuaD [Chlamydiia bacterium]
MRILIIGTGYVGLVTGACFAEMGHHVTCIDIDQAKIDRLNDGEIPIYEPGLEELVKRNKAAKRLMFSTEYTPSDAYFICVSTPPSEDGSADLDSVKAAAKSIAGHLTGYAVIVNKSTVPVGTAKIVEDILKMHSDHPFDVVSNPEFLKEGSAISDCMKPDRIVIGANSEKAAEIMQKIYQAFTFNHDRILMMDVLSAELTKYAANAMLATRISFMNELSGLCEKLGANINSVRVGIGSDKRIGFDFLYPGAGYGGSCFPKDIRALQATAIQNDYELQLVKAVEDVNAKQKQVLQKKIRTYFGSLKGLKIGVLGLSFKPDTDDIRESAAIDLVHQISDADVYVFDPIAMENARESLPNVHFVENEYELAKDADALVLMTEWKQFRYLDLDKIKELMKGKAFFDGRNQYSPGEMKKLGFDYFPIGYPQPVMLLSKLKSMHEKAR